MSRLAVRAPETLSMRTPDGVRLDADIYRPEIGDEYPVLLLRQAYGRRVAATVCYAHPSWYASQGYMVVVQDVRGRGTSEGRFHAFEHEIEDGAATVRWAAGLPGSTGRVGMYGFSYQGSNQLLAAIEAGPALAALAPAMLGWDLREGWAAEGNALRLSSSLGWGLQIGADSARHGGDPQAYLALRQAAYALPLHERLASMPEVMRRHGRWSHYPDWVERPATDPYWARVSPASRLEALRALDLPTLFIGGWYDGLLRGTLDAFHVLHASDRQRLVVGPWGHFPWTRRVGALDFGPEAEGGLDRLQIAWFDRWLKGREPDERPSGLTLFDMGACRWRDLPSWPKARTGFALDGDGRASVDPRAGRLLAPGSIAAPGEEVLVHDPWRPVPSTGGALGTPAGPVDRGGTDARGDVLTFTTDPLETTLSLAGAVEALLFLDSDADSFDVSVTVSRVTQAGQVYPLTDAYRRLDQHDSASPVWIACPGTCATLAPGEALRLSVAAASFPAYAVNPGTGADPASTPLDQARIITLRLRLGGACPSCLSLGLLPAETSA